MYADVGVLQYRTPVTSATDVEEKYKQVMMTNAQLDNDKQKLQYEVDLLKDRLADSQEQTIQLELHLARTTRVCYDCILLPVTKLLLFPQ